MTKTEKVRVAVEIDAAAYTDEKKSAFEKIARALLPYGRGQAAPLVHNRVEYVVMGVR